MKYISIHSRAYLYINGLIFNNIKQGKRGNIMGIMWLGICFNFLLVFEQYFIGFRGFYEHACFWEL
jgi:hypothetical protein